MNIKSILFFIISFFNLFEIRSYDIHQSNIAVQLSAVAYCGKDAYNTINYTGLLSGLEINKVLFDKKTDLQGFISTLHNQKTIYTIFRGTDSKLNWLDDAEVRKVKYTSYPDCNCYVHNGFYKSALSIKDETISTIKELKKKKPYDDYDVIITAHSYGASVGLLTSLEYFKKGLNNDLYTFGSPRVGDKSFANFYTNIIKNNYRFVHDFDTVPHLPFNSMGYYHGLTEYFEKDGIIKKCLLPEDPKCMNQYKLLETNTQDHLTYLNYPLTCLY